MSRGRLRSCTAFGIILDNRFKQILLNLYCSTIPVAAPPPTLLVHAGSIESLNRALLQGIVPGAIA